LTGLPRGSTLSLAPAGDDPSPGAAASSLRERDLRTSIRPTVATVDLDAVLRNAGRVRALLDPGTAVYGVVKADAYGHGAVRVARALSGSVDMLAVSLAEEGMELRAAGITAPILVLGAHYGREHSEALEEGLVPVIYDRGELERFAAAPTRRRARRGPGTPADDRIDVHVKIDTGMSRLGVSLVEVDAFAARLASLPRIRVVGACTHFACADGEDRSPTVEQLRRFDDALAILRRHGVTPQVLHAANTAGLVRFPEARLGAVRPGLALYGHTPCAVVSLPGLEPALRLDTRVMALHDLAPGTTVSYGAQFVARRPTRVATLPVGYADGYPRHVRGAEVIVRGRRAPVVGAVCMDMMMVDVTDVPAAALQDSVTLVGRDGVDEISADELAGWAGTVAYEILCGVSKRVPRLYVGGGGDAS
jgi:alanine racemase